jgi:hypothetical protein
MLELSLMLRKFYTMYTKSFFSTQPVLPNPHPMAIHLSIAIRVFPSSQFTMQ